MRVLIEGRLLDIGLGSKRKIWVDIKSFYMRWVKGFIIGYRNILLRLMV